jgi:hypothetical protein
MTEELVDSKFLLKGACCADDRPTGRSIRKRTPDDRTDIAESLIVVLLLSLGLWAAIWKAVTSVSAAL